MFTQNGMINVKVRFNQIYYASVQPRPRDIIILRKDVITVIDFVHPLALSCHAHSYTRCASVITWSYSRIHAHTPFTHSHQYYIPHCTRLTHTSAVIHISVTFQTNTCSQTWSIALHHPPENAPILPDTWYMNTWFCWLATRTYTHTHAHGTHWLWIHTHILKGL